MTQCIHYEDNIFFILDSLTFLERGLKLDIDENYFGEKIVTDILFFDSAIGRIFVSLKESTLQKDRNQYFRLLARTMDLFINICESITSKNTGTTIDFSGFMIKLGEILQQHKEYLEAVSDILKSGRDEEDGEEQISQEEMLFLMSREEESSTQ